MTEQATKLSIKNGGKSVSTRSAADPWHPLAGLRRELDHLLDEFSGSPFAAPFRRSMFDMEPFWRRDFAWNSFPAVDIVEKDAAYEITADVPGMDEKNIEVTLTNGSLAIRGEKHEEKEEKKKDYFLHERVVGTFERNFRLPEGIDRSKIDASFKKGVLTVTLPKTAEARKEQRISVKAT